MKLLFLALVLAIIANAETPSPSLPAPILVAPPTPLPGLLVPSIPIVVPAPEPDEVVTFKTTYPDPDHPDDPLCELEGPGLVQIEYLQFLVVYFYLDPSGRAGNYYRVTFARAPGTNTLFIGSALYYDSGYVEGCEKNRQRDFRPPIPSGMVGNPFAAGTRLFEWITLVSDSENCDAGEEERRTPAHNLFAMGENRPAPNFRALDPGNEILSFCSDQLPQGITLDPLAGTPWGS